MTQPGHVKIINPADQSVAEVPESSLPHHYRAGWAPLDESPEPDPEPDPVPVRATAKDKAGAKDKSSSKEGE